jgi:predicted nucleic acid-binding protein
VVLYDTGALIAAERATRRMTEVHAGLLRDGSSPVVPSVVLAQAWRGGPQPLRCRLLRGCRILPVDADLARAAGTACARAGTADVVDAVVAVTALALDAAVVTSDPQDLGRLGTALGWRLRMHAL